MHTSTKLVNYFQVFLMGWASVLNTIFLKSNVF